MTAAASNAVVTITDKTRHAITVLTPLLDLALRLWVAQVFWNSGMTKIQSWDTTLMLFEYEYAVPLLPFELAAILATGVELAAPILLVLGLGTRLGALALFVLNVVAVVAYPDISIAGIKDHTLWGVVLAVIFFHGPGTLSVDRWLVHKFLRPDQQAT